MAKTIRKVKGISRKRHSYQKMYVMKGCSKGSTRQKGSRKHSLRRGRMQHSLRRGRSIGLAGGNCTSCQSFNGGSSNALVGSPWSATDSEVQSSSNHYAQNMYKVDPQLMMQVRGGQGSKRRGRRKGSRRRGKRGGALMDLVPSDLVNLGRDVSYNVGSAYSSLTGATQPVNPNVTEQSLPTQVNLHKILV